MVRAMADSPICQICGGHNIAPFLEQRGMTLVRCRGCGFVWLHPLPGSAEVSVMYTDAYAGTTAGYFGKVDKKMRRSRGRARALRAMMPARASKPRLLDVGASGGFLVEAAREAGFDATGIELDAASVGYARAHYPQNRFVQGTVEEFAQQSPDTWFDAVYCSEVIEHVTDVNAFVAAIASVMPAGAILYLTTPDIGHWRRPRDITRWDAFDPPSHCLYFDSRTLKRLLARHGFSDIRRRFAWKPGLKVIARRR